MNSKIILENIQTNDVQIDKNTITTMQNTITKSTVNVLQSVVYEELSPIKKSAYNYIFKINNIVSKMQILVNLYNTRKRIKNQLKNQENSSLAQLYAQNTEQINQIHLTKIELEEVIKETDLFTMALQSFLGKQTEIVYIYQSKGGKVIQAYKINNIEDIIKIQKGHGGQLEAKLTATKRNLNTNNNIQYIGKEKYSIGLKQAEKLDSVWQAIIQRYNKYKYKGNAHLVLWDMMSRPKWHGMWLYQRGDLAEAYASFVLARHDTPFIGNVNKPPETDIEIFMQAVEKVDAAFGGLQGDIEYYDKDGNLISAAIKSLKASPQSAIETIKLAEQFLQSSMDENKFLQQYASKWERQGRNTIESFTVNEVKDLFKNIGNAR